jgi:DNA-binding transcriptional ArsR family regulator
MPAHRSSPKLELHDPRDIRALAHPARMAIIDALATGDELTATECAELTGLSASATAYHLKLLQRYDFAERAPARNDGRERPWRATSRGGTVDLDTSTPAGAAAVAAVGLAHFERSRTLAEEFIAGERHEPEEWQNVAAPGPSRRNPTGPRHEHGLSAPEALKRPGRARTARVWSASGRRDLAFSS